MSAVKSMTGCGQGAVESGDLRAEVELKGVNHRYLDVKMRLPAEASSLEPALRTRVQERVQRGRLDITVTLRRSRPAAPRVEVNRDLAAAYLKEIAALRRRFRLKGAPGIEILTTLPGVVTVQPGEAVPAAEIADLVRRAVDQALAAYDTMRTEEGERLSADLEGRLRAVTEQLRIIEDETRGAAEQYAERLRRRLAALTGEQGLDPARLAQEAAILADRIDVTEEIVRLRGYLEQSRGLLGSGDGPVGKTLDFVLQEMNREANTVSSKAESLAACQAALRIKTEVEKMREQVQNLE